MVSMRTISGESASFIGAGVTAYLPWGNATYARGDTTEAKAQIPVRFSAGVNNNLQVVINSNATTATSTARTRKNTANGAMSVTIGIAATGSFEDTTNSDTYVIGDKLNYQLVWGAGGTGNAASFAVNNISNSGIFMRYVSQSDNDTDPSFSTASQTNYCPLSGTIRSLTTTEANVQFKCNAAATMRNLAVYIVTNSRTDATTYGSRIATANGTLSISVGSAATGLIEDTTHTDAIASGNLINYFQTLGSGTGSIVPHFLSTELSTTIGRLPFITGNTAGATQTTGLTRFIPITGNLVLNASDAPSQVLAKGAYKLTNLYAYVPTNTVTAASTITFRKNTANANMNLSIGSSATGAFEDTTNADSVVSADSINLQSVTGATGTSLIATIIGMMAYANQGDFLSFM